MMVRVNIYYRGFVILMSVHIKTSILLLMIFYITVGVCGQSEILVQDDDTTQRPALPGVIPEIPIYNPNMPTTSSPIRHFLGAETTSKGPLWLPPSLTAYVPVLGSV